MRTRQVVATVALAACALAGVPFAAITSTSRAPAWPTSQTAGVPAGTVLTPYAGPNPIRQCGARLDKVVVNGDLTILAGNGTRTVLSSCVVITSSRINGIIDDKWAGFSCGGHVGCGPVLVANSEVANPTARDVAAVSESNYFLWNSYVHGARSGVQCDGWCWVVNSVLVADTEYGNAHMDAFISNGNYGAPMVLQDSTFLCKPNGPVPNGAGCSADIGLFGDFSAITNTRVTGNLIRSTTAAYYCAHTGYEPKKPYPAGGGIIWSDNTFERGTSGKCGDAGPVYAWANSAGVWCRNRYPDGTAVLASNRDNC